MLMVYAKEAMSWVYESQHSERECEDAGSKSCMQGTDWLHCRDDIVSRGLSGRLVLVLRAAAVPWLICRRLSHVQRLDRSRLV